mgnify:CR=1 FL=1
MNPALQTFVRLARPVPAVRLVYGSFQGLDELLDRWLTTLPQP